MNYIQVFLLVILLATMNGAGPTMASAAELSAVLHDSSNDCLLKAMDDEIARSMDKLQLTEKPKPYFLRYEITDLHSRKFSYELGANYMQQDESKRFARVDLRVGNYDFDNNVYLDTTKHDVPNRALPIDNDYAGVRRQLWLMTDAAYKQATKQLEKAQFYKSGHTDHRLCESFSREPTRQTLLPLGNEFEIPPSYRLLIQKASKLFQKYPQVICSAINFEAMAMTKRVANSEGTHSRYSHKATFTSIVANAYTQDGLHIGDSEYLFANQEKDLPTAQELESTVCRMAEKLTAECNADRMEYYFGPVLFENAAASEIVDHMIAPLLCAVPGDNMQHGSKTLLKSLNTRILPEFISISDDPTLQNYQGRPIDGHLRIDSDGIPTQTVTLIDHGFLRNFLSGRNPIYNGEMSNGHNINENIAPTTLILNSDRKVQQAMLRKQLMDLAKARGMKEAIVVRRIAPYGAIMQGGKRTENRARSIGRLIEIYAVNVDSGAERRVRGLSLVDFDRKSMESVLATGDDQQAFTIVDWNGYIHTVICPSLLVDSIELEEDDRKTLSPYPVDKPNNYSALAK